ncbi:mitochondrial ribonuclease P catalytic subunit isoform X2 [Calliopsis andreniformis]|uniref:mitochondrial ribonuclease P catalytic subunit isoform X2 n=1 Tax=Calliopsis andreniformis TaxID=337506 RepID=UPI003FCED2A4
MAFLSRFTFLSLHQVQSFSTQTGKFNIKHILHYKRRDSLNYILNKCKDEYINVLGKPNVSREELDHMRKSLTDIKYVTPTIIDSLVLDVCKNQGCIDGGIAYFQFVEASGHKSSIVTIAKYLLLYGNKTDAVTEAQREHIQNLCETILKQFSVLDHATANACIVGLCKIGEWQKSIEVIQKFESHDPSFLRTGYNALINCLYNNGQADLGTYIQYCLKDLTTFNENIEKLFNLWQTYDIKPSSDTVEELIDTCNKVGWHANLANMTLSKCEICGHEMTEVSLSDEEFKYLSQTIMQKLFVDRIYQVTSPDELKAFKNFIDKTKPYDVVIDGLNIVLNGKEPNYHNLHKLIMYFNAKKQKSLIIGRLHLAKKKEIQFLQKKTTFFFVNNLSSDDPFILYAAMASGLNCKVVSQDFLRQHRFKLQDNTVRVLFKRWQLTHQYMSVEDILKPINLNLVHGESYGVQKQNEYWHIPFHKLTHAQRVNHIEPNQWACFKMST